MKNDNSIVSFYPLKDELYAASETNLIHRVDPMTLETIEKVLCVKQAQMVATFRLLIDPLPPPPPPRGDFVHYNFLKLHFVHYNFLKLHFIRRKMTHVGHLTAGALPCNSHVNYVTLKHILIHFFKFKAIHNSYLFTC